MTEEILLDAYGFDDATWLAWGSALLHQDPGRQLAGWDALRDRMLEAGVDQALIVNDASTAMVSCRGAATEALADCFAAAYLGIHIATWQIAVGRSGSSTTDPRPLDTILGALASAVPDRVIAASNGANGVARHGELKPPSR